PIPRPGPGEALVKVGAAGICASDIKCYIGGHTFWGEHGEGGYCEAPVTAGHEFAGRVVALGEGAAERHGIQPGDHVVAEQIIPCGQCRFCKNGQYWMCEPHVIFGFKRGRAEGGMAEYMIYPANARIHVIDPRISPRQAAYIEPLACAVHAVDRGEIKPGDTVVIAGVGNIGLCMLQAAKRFNPGQLIALDTKNYRLELATRLGADIVINPLEEDAVARVKALTGGYGCDVFIEVSGNVVVPQMGLEMIRRLGTLVAFSVMAERSTLDWNLVGDQKELNVHGSHLGPYCYPSTIRAIAEGEIDVESLISAEFPLTEFPSAMEAARGGDNLKTLLIP
ncbi:MAG TPA: alcohol dehydrogenase catalytic domain-containing protein, partial [Chloroflexota bacterium]|nr:alcohol dehydrogenase catalytic domain-containing protein [Chloroflexota bacterium]